MNERIVIDPKICHGKPVIRGTPVAIVVGSLAGGMSFADIEREHRRLSENRSRMEVIQDALKAGD